MYPCPVLPALVVQVKRLLLFTQDTPIFFCWFHFSPAKKQSQKFCACVSQFCYLSDLKSSSKIWDFACTMLHDFLQNASASLLSQPHCLSFLHSLFSLQFTWNREICSFHMPFNSSTSTLLVCFFPAPFSIWYITCIFCLHFSVFLFVSCLLTSPWRLNLLISR